MSEHDEQQEIVKEAVKEAYKEVLQEQLARVGGWTLGTVAVAAVGLLIYIIATKTGWSPSIP